MGKTIALPANRTKNNRPHDVPLSAAALAVLDTCTRAKGKELVFGNRRRRQRVLRLVSFEGRAGPRSED